MDVPFHHFEEWLEPKIKHFYCKYWEEKEKKYWPSDLWKMAENLRIGIIELQSKIRLLEIGDC